MVTLYKKATPSQKRILRAVEGAVKNAADGHPEWQFTPTIARSIAKRAAGTLSAQWPGVLAASLPLSERSGERHTYSSTGPVSDPGTRSRADLSEPNGRGMSQRSRHPPLRFLRLWAGAMAKSARGRAPEREAAFVEVLRMISELEGSDDQ